MRLAQPDLIAKWLESDSLGGFASGTVGGFRTRRCHALLLTPLRPPGERVVLVNGFEAWVETAAGAFPLSTQHYAPDVLCPRGFDHVASFNAEPWPRWTRSAGSLTAMLRICRVAAPTRPCLSES